MDPKGRAATFCLRIKYIIKPYADGKSVRTILCFHKYATATEKTKNKIKNGNGSIA